MYRAVLKAAQPFSLRAMAEFLPCAGDQQIVDGAVRKAFMADGRPVIAEVSQDPAGVLLVGHGRPGARLGAGCDGLPLADDPTPFPAAAARHRAAGAGPAGCDAGVDPGLHRGDRGAVRARPVARDSLAARDGAQVGLWGYHVCTGLRWSGLPE